MNLADRLRNPAWQGDLRPMIDRLEGDLIHDLFVPRYSSLTEGRPSWVHLVGVWLLFGPAAIVAPIGVAHTLSYSLFHAAPDHLYSSLFSLVVALSFWVIEVLLLIKVTRRFLDRRKRWQKPG
ncbi:MAG: hypothetical protein AAFY08_12030 [Planctomycetota bacterium]